MFAQPLGITGGIIPDLGHPLSKQARLGGVFGGRVVFQSSSLCL